MFQDGLATRDTTQQVELSMIPEYNFFSCNEQDQILQPVSQTTGCAYLVQLISWAVCIELDQLWSALVLEETVHSPNLNHGKQTNSSQHNIRGNCNIIILVMLLPIKLYQNRFYLCPIWIAHQLHSSFLLQYDGFLWEQTPPQWVAIEPSFGMYSLYTEGSGHHYVLWSLLTSKYILKSFQSLNYTQ